MRVFGHARPTKADKRAARRAADERALEVQLSRKLSKLRTARRERQRSSKDRESQPESSWQRDLTREGVEKNPGPVPWAFIRTTALNVKRFYRGDAMADMLVDTVLAVVDIGEAPDVVHAFARVVAHSDQFGECQSLVAELWAELAPLPESQSPVPSEVLGALWPAVFRAVSLLSVTRLFGRVPDARVRSVIRAMVDSVHDRDDLEQAMRDFVGTMVTAIPAIILRGDFSVLVGSPGAQQLAAAAHEQVRRLNQPCADNFVMLEHESRLCLEALDSALAKERRPPLAISVAATSLRSALTAARTAAGATTRMVPFAVELLGPPGCGKSTFAYHLAAVLLTSIGRRCARESIVSHRDTKYCGDYLHPWTNAVVMDDFLASQPLGPVVDVYAASITLIQQLISNQPFETETAGLEGKSGRYVAPALVVACGNMALDQRLKHVATDVRAVKRRFVRLTISPSGREMDASHGILAMAETWNVVIGLYNVQNDAYVEQRFESVDVWLPCLVALCRVHYEEQLALLARTTTAGDGLHPDLHRFVTKPMSQTAPCGQPQRVGVANAVLDGLVFAPVLATMVVGIATIVAARWAWVVGRTPFTVEEVFRCAMAWAPSRVRFWLWSMSSGRWRVIAGEELLRSFAARLVMVASFAAAAYAAVAVTRRLGGHPQPVQSRPSDQTGTPATQVWVPQAVPAVPQPITISPAAMHALMRQPLDAVRVLPALAAGFPRLQYHGKYRQPVPWMMTTKVPTTMRAMAACVMRSVVRLSVPHADGRVCPVTALVLGRGFVVTVAHVFRNVTGATVLTVEMRAASGVGFVRRTCPFDLRCVCVDATRDLAVAYIPCLVTTDFVSLEWFGDGTVEKWAAVSVVDVSCRESSELVVRERVCVVKGVAASVVTTDGTRRGPSVIMDMDGAVGECGGVMTDRFGKVIALHSFGWPPSQGGGVGGVLVTADLVAPLLRLAQSSSGVPYSQLRVDLSVEQAECLHLGPLGRADSAAYLQAGENVAILGVVTTRSDSHASWRETAYARRFPESDYLPALLRPVLAPLVGDASGVVNPFQLSMQDTVSLRCAMSAASVRAFCRFVAGACQDLVVGPVAPLLAAFGRYGDHIRGVDPRRAAGPGFPGEKGDYFTTEVGVPKTVDPRLSRAVEVLTDKLRNDGVVESRWSMFAKDELRPPSKIRVGATRAIQVAPMDQYMLGRMYLNPVLDVLLRARWRLGIMVGVNALVDAGAIVERAAAVAPDLLGFAGDWKSFDSLTSAGTFRAVCAAALAAAVGCGYEASDAALAWQCMSLLCPRVVGYDTVVFGVSSGNPSGAVGTTMWNCLANILYMWHAYEEGRSARDPDFADAVYPVVYGDDFVMFVAPSVRSWYTPVYLAERSRVVFGQQLTAADKGAPGREYEPLAELTFLKRRFVHRKSSGRWVLALEESSMVKPLRFAAVQRRGDSPEARLARDAACLVNTYREAWAHGPEFLAKWRPRLLEAAADCGPGAVKFPTDAELESELAAGTFVTWDGGGELAPARETSAD